MEGEGVEFWLQKGSVREYHQVKRQQSAEGRWTMATLAAKGVLSHFWEKLHDPSAQCVFVSTHAAFQLEELADRARRAASWEEFQQVFLLVESQAMAFKDLCSRLALSPSEAIYALLKRISLSDTFLTSKLKHRKPQESPSLHSTSRQAVAVRAGTN